MSEKLTNGMKSTRRLALTMGCCLLMLSCLLQAAAAAEPRQNQGTDRMAWFREARLGMFIHFGLYSTAAGEWEGQPVGFSAYFGFRNPADWQTLLPRFNPTEFDADRIVRAAKDTGMKYLIVTSKHHDGFCLFDSEHTDFDVMSTPFKRDIIGELAAACREHGLRFGVYYSIIDLHHPDYLPRHNFDPRPADDADFDRYVAFMKKQIKELLSNYGELDVLWFDGEWESTWNHEHAKDMWAYIRGIDEDILINNRIDKGRGGMQGMNKADHFLGDFGTPEQELLERNPGEDWETCQTMNRHGNWGWRRDEGNYYSKTELIRQIISCASMGGNMLLNIGPKDDGSIPPAQLERLKAIGRWTRVHGEAIYGTSASPFDNQLPWGRVTVKNMDGGKSHLYLHVFDWPDSREILLPPLENEIRSVKLLDGGDKLESKDTRAGTLIHLPPQPRHEAATVVVVEIDGTPLAVEPIIPPDESGVYRLGAAAAQLHGSLLSYPSGGGSQDSIGYWTSPQEWVSWNLDVPEAGTYRVEITYGCEEGSGGKYRIEIPGGELEGVARPTGGWFARKTESPGTIALPAGRNIKLALKVVDKTGVAIMDLSGIELKPFETPTD